jgi:hypothetical protein
MAYPINVRNITLYIKRFFNIEQKIKDLLFMPYLIPSMEYFDFFEPELWEGETDDLDMTGTGLKLAFTVPEDEIWIPEQITIFRTTGAVARFSGLQWADKEGGQTMVYTPVRGGLSSLNFFRGGDGEDGGLSPDWYLFPNNVIYAEVSTADAGDFGAIRVVRRVIKIGD